MLKGKGNEIITSFRRKAGPRAHAALENGRRSSARPRLPTGNGEMPRTRQPSVSLEGKITCDFYTFRLCAFSNFNNTDSLIYKKDHQLSQPSKPDGTGHSSPTSSKRGVQRSAWRGGRRPSPAGSRDASRDGEQRRGAETRRLAVPPQGEDGRDPGILRGAVQRTSRSRRPEHGQCDRRPPCLISLIQVSTVRCGHGHRVGRGRSGRFSLNSRGSWAAPNSMAS